MRIKENPYPKFMSFNFPYPGPVPPYTNVPIEPQYYQPSVFTISGITLGLSTTVTTSVNHNYVVGQLCRLLIPPSNGCYELNESSGYVTSIPSANQVVLNIFSNGIDSFKTSTNQTQSPQIMAIGDINMGITSSTGASIPTTNIPGAFINISPL